MFGVDIVSAVTAELLQQLVIGSMHVQDPNSFRREARSLVIRGHSQSIKQETILPNRACQVRTCSFSVMQDDLTLLHTLVWQRRSRYCLRETTLQTRASKVRTCMYLLLSVAQIRLRRVHEVWHRWRHKSLTMRKLPTLIFSTMTAQFKEEANVFTTQAWGQACQKGGRSIDKLGDVEAESSE